MYVCKERDREKERDRHIDRQKYQDRDRDKDQETERETDNYLHNFACCDFLEVMRNGGHFLPLLLSHSQHLLGPIQLSLQLPSNRKTDIYVSVYTYLF